MRGEKGENSTDHWRLVCNRKMGVEESRVRGESSGLVMALVSYLLLLVDENFAELNGCRSLFFAEDEKA